MPFSPDEILFSPTTNCNLICPHCDIKRSNDVLSVKVAKKFLIDCKKNGINRIGFTGGEPFLSGNFLYSIIKFAVKKGFLFARIITNGVWYKDEGDLNGRLKKLFNSGYDGSICVSVDAYHRQNLKKVVGFIKTAQSIWRRPDLISIVYVTGQDRATESKLQRLAGLLKGRLSGFSSRHPHIRTSGIFIKIDKIVLSPIGKAEKLKDPWDGKWFKEDYCKGPGNLFFVEPSGEVKPCCGYASELSSLSIGNIKRNTASEIIKNVHKNRIVCAIFDSGLTSVRERLARSGVVFPGKTSNHCFFCHYILERYAEEPHLLSGDSRSI